MSLFDNRFLHVILEGLGGGSDFLNEFIPESIKIIRLGHDQFRQIFILNVQEILMIYIYRSVIDLPCLSIGCQLDRRIDEICELLEEQEPVKPIRLENWWECPSCNGNIVANMKYCPECGKAVKWDG